MDANSLIVKALREVLVGDILQEFEDLKTHIKNEKKKSMLMRAVDILIALGGTLIATVILDLITKALHITP